jgi:cytochrome c oxidase subunit 4
MDKPTRKMNALKRGVVIFAVLAVLTLIEYFIATLEGPAVFLWIIALAKAGLVLWFFMHLPRVFSQDEGGHE